MSCVLRIVRDVVHTLARGGWRGLNGRVDTLVLRRPGLAAVIGAEEPGSGYADPHAVRVLRVRQDGMRAKSAETRHPAIARGMVVEAIDRLPACAIIAADKKACFGNAGIERAVRPVHRPYLVDEAAPAFQHAFEIHLRDDAVVFGIAAVFGPVARRGLQLFPVLQIVADEQCHAIVRAVHRRIDAAFVVARRRGDGPALQNEILVPVFAIFAGEDRCALRRADDE